MAEVFNLGNNKPVELMTFLNLIEEDLGRKATYIYKNSSAEIAVTYSNIDKASDKLGFSPTVDIETGVKKFIEWYKGPLRRDKYSEGKYREA